jgi:hypothetical protein
MIIVNNLDNEQITGSYSGKSFSINFDKIKFELMKEYEQKANSATTMEELKSILEEFEPLTHESYKEMVESACPYIVVNKSTNRFYLTYNGEVSSHPMPTAFADGIVKSMEKGIDMTPFIKCWVRFLKPLPGKPAYSEQRAKDFAYYITAKYTDAAVVDKLMREHGLSREVATKKATVPQVPITLEGLLVCNKVSKEIRIKWDLNDKEEVITKSRYTKKVDPDTGLVTYEEPEHAEDLLFEPAIMGTGGDEFNCVSLDGTINKKGHHIRVGCRHFLDSWDQVSSPGVKGLHVGNKDYIKSYQTEGRVTHDVFVDPMHIHSVNTSYDGALTCLEYFTYATAKCVNKNLYHSSSYAAFTDEVYRKNLAEVVEASKMKQAELAKFQAEAGALAGTNIQNPVTALGSTPKLEIDDLSL